MTRLAFAPVVPLSLLTALAVIALAITLYGFFVHARGTWARGLAFTILLFALAGPMLVKEQRASLPDVAVIVTDRSQSMSIGKRSAQAEAARAQLRKMLAAQPNLTVRETSITTTATGENNGTQAFAALNAALADVPQGRVAGAILITDGQVHDAPSPENLALKAPLQVLVAGEPHAGERVWRNLLKADPSVDLIHFTILRPPDKQDSTPLNELSLIAFPYRELFLEKLDSFDLVVFDRYRERGILPLAYFQNIASYVQNGGALLISSGPEFAGPESVYRTPLSQVLPAQPTGQVVTGGFRPQVTQDGMAHPVTRELPGRNQDGSAAIWGRWFRVIASNRVAGQTVMASASGQPLLVLDQVGKGRVAGLMSDQTWLWARGFEGGGPQAELLRRLAHWLMKEPELEAENLSIDIVGGDVRITRRTMAAKTPPVNLTLPSGRQVALPLTKAEPGIWRATAKAGELGLYRATDGILSAVTAAGPLNPKEVADMRASADVLQPVADASGGSVHWLEDGVPEVRRVDSGDTASGSNWIGLNNNGAYRVTALEQQKLLPQWLALLLIVGALLLAWRLEGR